MLIMLSIFILFVIIFAISIVTVKFNLFCFSAAGIFFTMIISVILCGVTYNIIYKPVDKFYYFKTSSHLYVLCREAQDNEEMFFYKSNDINLYDAINRNSKLYIMNKYNIYGKLISKELSSKDYNTNE